MKNKLFLGLIFLFNLSSAQAALEAKETPIELPGGGFDVSNGNYPYSFTTKVQKIEDKENHVVCYLTYNSFSGNPEIRDITIMKSSPNIACVKVDAK